ncbi:hypothetical protein J6590_068634 [Homalodisca vitripennis]|nr:hypothetical protein J6590_068631 [Homalodisca vitripennis]KAG8271209.1 hypothetical protein J6590_068634 [Homalodisca vitripennis]
MYSLVKFAVFLIVAMLFVSQCKCRSLPAPQSGGGLTGGLLEGNGPVGGVTGGLTGGLLEDNGPVGGVTGGLTGGLLEDNGPVGGVTGGLTGII